ncbi:MAG: hypothetical protein U0Y68_17805 [Blastocatellia bacterium]
MNHRTRIFFLWLLSTLFVTGYAQGQPVAAQVKAAASATTPAPESLSAAEFSRLSRELSEEGGYFRSDNFTSNETSYLHVVDKMRQLGATGGAYLGVGPEQNYTYIAKVRPRMAFLLDIRRQAIIQHLMYKAIFHLSPTRAQFLSRLISRPLPKDNPLKNDASINDIMNLLNKQVVDEKAYSENLVTIRKMIQDEFQFPLSETDQKSLEYVYKSFREDGLEIQYRVDGTWGNNGFPTLQEIIAQPDQNGKQGNFLVTNEDYEFMRGMHRKNLIIPVVGDFGGSKAIASVAEYLRRHNLTVTAFYTSNVEQYLYSGNTFAAFAANVKKLPITDKSLFIRAVPVRYPQHPAQLPGHRLVTLLQFINVFLKDFEEGLYPSYRELTTIHFIETNK